MKRYCMIRDSLVNNSVQNCGEVVIHNKAIPDWQQGATEGSNVMLAILWICLWGVHSAAAQCPRGCLLKSLSCHFSTLCFILGLKGRSQSRVWLSLRIVAYDDISDANKERASPRRVAGDFISPFRYEDLPRFFTNHVFRVFRQHRDSWITPGHWSITWIDVQPRLLVNNLRSYVNLGYWSMIWGYLIGLFVNTMVLINNSGPLLTAWY